MSLLSRVTVENKSLWLAALISGVLMWLAWPPWPLAFLIFTGFIPLFWIAEKVTENYSTPVKKGAKYIYAGLFLWNLLTTYWIYNATIFGAGFAILANAFLMTLPWMVFIWSLKHFGRWPAYPVFIIFWIGLEFLHLNWELAWPWLNLGNAFSLFPGWVQWYEYTGALGGTLWVLLINILLYRGYDNFYQLIRGETHPKTLRVRSWSYASIFAGILLLPLLWSGYLKEQYQQAEETVSAGVIQPNVDPYEEKFDEMSVDEQLSILLNLSREAADQGAELIIWPETALPENVRQDDFETYVSVRETKAFLEEHPDVDLIIGATTFEIYETEAEKTPTARNFENREGWYDVYNSAIYWDGEDDFQLYHKSRLVPGVERMPYPAYLNFLEPLALDLGGIVGSMGTQEAPSSLEINENIRAAPVICYESVFGDYTRGFVEDRANLIVIITNDGWWGDTEGYQQHYHYASLRAIETRRSIARAANTGISGFFNPLGNSLGETPFWQKDQMVKEVTLNESFTFYTKHGDYIGRIGFFSGLIYLLGMLCMILGKGTKNNKGVVTYLEIE